MHKGVISLFCEYMTIKSFKFSEILRPNVGLIDPGPLDIGRSGVDRILNQRPLVLYHSPEYRGYVKISGY